MRAIVFTYIFILFSLIFAALTYDKTITPTIKYIRKKKILLRSKLIVITKNTCSFVERNKKLQILLYILTTIVFIYLFFEKNKKLSPSDKAASIQLTIWLSIYFFGFLLIASPLLVILLIIFSIGYFSKKDK